MRHWLEARNDDQSDPEYEPLKVGAEFHDPGS